jgi:ribulose-phosphate 3-epimerase
MNKNNYIPAVLPTTLSDIELLVARTGRASKLLQIDLCDGKYVETQTWPYIKSVLPVFNDDFELPGWENFDFEFDLMIQNPELYIDNLKNCGISRVVLHLTSTSELGILEAAEKLNKYDIAVGIAVQNSYDKELLARITTALTERNIDFYLQVMGIEVIGKQGQAFAEQTLDTIVELRSLYPETVLQVDGSVNEDTIEALRDAGATSFVLGSYLSGGVDSVDERIKYLKNLLY